MKLVFFVLLELIIYFYIENDCGDSSDEQNCHGEYKYKYFFFFYIKKFEFLERICDPLTQFTCPHTPGKCIPNGMLKIKYNYF